MKKIVWYLGVLPLLSCLYFQNHDQGFLLFFSFILFFFIHLTKKDEHIDINIGLATSNFFFSHYLTEK